MEEERGGGGEGSQVDDEFRVGGETNAASAN
jgi:hypothetical protein